MSLGYNKILIKRNSNTNSIPLLSSIDVGELSLNTADGKIFTKTVNGSLTSIVSFLNDNDYPYTLNHYYSSVNFKYGNNTVNQVFASVLNGYNNDITGGGSSVINGEDNDIAGDFSLIGSGLKNKITANGDYSFIAAGSSNLISHTNSFILGSGLSSHSANFTYVNNLSSQGNIYGQFQINASDITSGTLNAARLPVFNGDISATTTNGSVSAKVIAIQGEPISTQTPSNGQVLQWNGTAWTPGTIPTGGSGGGGLVYFLNQALSGQLPTTNLPLSAQLGRIGISTQTVLTSPTLSQVSYTLIAGFVTDVLDPNTDYIPAGIWDFNIWGYSNASANNPTVMQVQVYKYNGVNTPTLISTSDDTTLTDSGLFVQHPMSCLVPQTSASLMDRIYIEVRAKASAGGKTVTLAFGDSTPSHVHTTLPSVGGSGLVKVIDGVVQSPASLLVNSDVASNALIDQSKINGLTDITGKTNSVYTTVNNNSAYWDTAYNIATAYKSISSTFLTAETDSQTLIFNDTNKNLSISNGNTISLSALASGSLDTGVRLLTSKWEDTSTTVQTKSADWGSTASGTLTNTLSVIDTSQGIYKNGDLIPVGTSIETILINMLKSIVPPTYTAPTISVAYGSPSIVATYEVGYPISSFTITPTFTTNDSGGLINFTYYKDATNLGTGSTKLVNSFSINSSTTLKVDADYSQGPIKNDNLGNPYPTGRINAGTLTSTATLNVLYPYFWGKSSTLPTAASIASDIQNGSANKVLASASGTVSVTYNASGEYIWLAHTTAQTEKTKWYVTALNNGSIGSGQAINSPVTQNVTSPDAYWSSVNFKIYISSGKQQTTGAFEYRNS